MIGRIDFLFVSVFFSRFAGCHDNYNWQQGKTCFVQSTGLQITVGHRTMANQNLPMSNEIATLVGHFVWPIFCCNIWLYPLQIKFDFLIRYSFQCIFVFMSDQIFLLSNKNGALVGHMSFQGKKIICSLEVTNDLSGGNKLLKPIWKDYLQRKFGNIWSGLSIM